MNHLLSKSFLKEEYKKQHLWALCELTTNAILGLTPELNKLWEKETQGYNKYLKNYKQLTPLKSKIKQIYLTRKDFKDYIKKQSNL